MFLYVFLFFKQKTAYEMRISDWSSDVCSSDLSGVLEVRGSHPVDRKENTLAAFVDGSCRVLITKPSLTGYGLNWQHCALTVFAGRSFSYERSEEHTSELQSLMRISYAVFCLKKKNTLTHISHLNTSNP